MPTPRWGVRACVSALPWPQCEWGRPPPASLVLYTCLPCKYMVAAPCYAPTACWVEFWAPPPQGKGRCDEGRGQGTSNKRKVTWGAQWKQRWWEPRLGDWPAREGSAEQGKPRVSAEHTSSVTTSVASGGTGGFETVKQEA